MEDLHEDQETIHRGKPRKQMQPFKFGEHVYKTPLGFQYTQPRLLAHTMQSPIFAKGVGNEDKTEKRERRVAAVKAAHSRKKRVPSDESTSDSSATEESVVVEEDPYEKLLDYDSEKDMYLVKLRNRSYLHSQWVPGVEMKSSRVGAIKVKRFKKIEVDPSYTQVDRVLTESYEEGERLVLIKWRNLPYEASTFELFGDVEKCEGFEEALEGYRERKKMRHTRVGIDWRPGREEQKKYATSPEYKGGNKLREYQLEGLNWLLNRWYFRQSCIMADEMGLGKTVQSVVFVNVLFAEYEYTAPVLIVAPLSTLVHWEREFKNWTDLRVLTYHGSIQGREVIAEYEFQVKAGNINVRLFDVLITTYEMAMAGSEHLGAFEYGVGIFDEAHRLKNPNSKAAKCLRGLAIKHRVLLSGTPIQNNLNELWALFNFIDPQRFNDLDAFLGEYKMEKIEDVEKLQAVLRPLMLRRMKEDVETSIPLKVETILEVNLTMIQKRYYRAILEKNLEFLTRTDKSNAPNLINVMMELRKCCIHPFLLNGAEEKILGDHLKRNPVDASTEQSLEHPVYLGGMWWKDPSKYFELMILSSGKLLFLDKLLAKLAGNHKVLIFSQMTRCLDLLSEYLNYRQYKYERIDGGVRGDLRQAAIDRFSTGDAFVFLLCTRAGGVGINLTAADTVVIFDSDWNPQNDLQAQARCHRIGQKNNVQILRLIVRNSYEREMFDKAGMKLGLDRAILQRMSYDQKNTDTSVSKVDAVQLLLRKGAYGVLMETDDASRNFCEMDIDQILQERTHVVNRADNSNAFSKAYFQANEADDDHDFWSILATEKRSKQSEGSVRRQCRRLSREGVILIEDRDRLEAVRTTLAANDPEDALFRTFTTVLLDGYAAAGTEACGPIIRYCLELISNQKNKNDYSIHISHLSKPFDPNLFVKYSDEYLKYHEQFLLRLQIPMIVSALEETDDLVAERARGWTHKEDAELFKDIIEVGYDCKSSAGKSQEECNLRIRKILPEMYHRKEVKENDIVYYNAILNFGRPSDLNELALESYLNKDPSKLNSIIESICSMSRRARKDTPEAHYYDRIMFFDRLAGLDDDFPSVRRVGMPKKWDKSKDIELRDHLLSEGFIGITEKFGLQEDQVLKRFETIFRACNILRE